jgi:transposase
MLNMNQIDRIKELQREGFGPSEISERVGVDRKTVSKYMNIDDFSPTFENQKVKKSKLDSWKSVINAWLEEDKTMRFKQRHTATRIHARLQEEQPDSYNCSYGLVQRYVKQKKTERKESPGFMDLHWQEGEAQADFGEADIIEDGEKKTVKYFALTFPASNAGFTQVFGGETAECVTQGLQNIFTHIGGVPSRIVFDNATGVGKRVRERVTFAELFLRFKSHYGFSVSFCNPASGNEKGNVENKVGYFRRNFFVPIPKVDSIKSFNAELFVRADQDMMRPHYKKGLTIAELFKEEKKHLGNLPCKPFNVVRFKSVNTDGYGKFCLDGKHWYSSAPEHANKELVVGIKAEIIDVYQKNGELIYSHTRIYGEDRSDSCDYQTSLETLVKKIGAWQNSALRLSVDEQTRTTLDAMTKPDLRKVLKDLAKSSTSFGFDIAIEALAESVHRGVINTYSFQTLAARMSSDSLMGVPIPGLDLSIYDRTFMPISGGAV